jgi:signal peptidase II
MESSSSGSRCFYFTTIGSVRTMTYGVIILAVIILDRVTKFLLQHAMAEGESIPIIPGILHCTYILNPGAAFGLLEYRRVFFIAITVIAIVAVIVFRRRIAAEDRLTQTGMAFFIGGAVGNLIDRIQTGYVIDFIDFRIWPIFNVADIFICTGVGLILWSMIRNEQTQKIQS